MAIERKKQLDEVAKVLVLAFPKCANLDKSLYLFDFWFFYLQNGVGLSRNWATAHVLTFMVGLGTVMAPVGVSLRRLIYYNKYIMRLKVYWKSNLQSS